MTDDYFTIQVEPARSGADGVVTSWVRLAGEFDIDTREELSDVLKGAVGAGDSARVVVDLAEVRFVDSEAISAVIDGLLAAEDAGVELRLAGASGIVERVITVIGLGHLLDSAVPEP